MKIKPLSHHLRYNSHAGELRIRRGATLKRRRIIFGEEEGDADNTYGKMSCHWKTGVSRGRNRS